MSHVSDRMRVGPAYFGLAKQSDGGSQGVALPYSVTQEFGAVAAPSTNNICVAATVTAAKALSATGTLVSGGVATLDVARNVSLTATSNLATKTMTVVGTDQYGQAQTEKIAGPNSNTVNGVKAFKTVTSITTTGAISKLSVGIGQVLGLPWRIGDKGKFLGLRVDGATVVPTIVTGLSTTAVATATNGDVRGTITCTTAPNATKMFTAELLVDPSTKNSLYGVTPA